MIQAKILDCLPAAQLGYIQLVPLPLLVYSLGGTQGPNIQGSNMFIAAISDKGSPRHYHFSTVLHYFSKP
jgi:hypothetical protein